MGERLTYFSVDDAKRENIKFHAGWPIIETGGGGGRNHNWQGKMTEVSWSAKKRGEKLKFRSARGRSFGNADVIFRLTVLRGGWRNAKRMQLGGMQVIL
jgi:hypothetical protein